MSEEQNDVFLGAGKIIVFSDGEYSDYSYSGMYVTLRPLLRSELREAAEQTKAEHEAAEAARDAWRPADSMGAPPPSVPDIHELYQTNLIKRGLLMVVDYREMHVGSYSKLEPRL